MASNQHREIHVVTKNDPDNTSAIPYLVTIQVTSPYDLLPQRAFDNSRGKEPSLLTFQQGRALMYEVASKLSCIATSNKGALQLSIVRQYQLPRTERIALKLVLDYLQWSPETTHLEYSAQHTGNGFNTRLEELCRTWGARHE